MDWCKVEFSYTRERGVLSEAVRDFLDKPRKKG